MTTNNFLFFLNNFISEIIVKINMITVLFCKIGENPSLMNLRIIKKEEISGISLFSPNRYLKIPLRKDICKNLETKKPFIKIIITVVMIMAISTVKVFFFFKKYTTDRKRRP